MFNLENGLDIELPDDEGIGPVLQVINTLALAWFYCKQIIATTEFKLHCSDSCFLFQFDYGALADELFQLASRNNTPSFNRQKLYKVIKMSVSPPDPSYYE